MIDLKYRSYKAELLDAENIPAADIALNLKELEFINKHLGGHAITIRGFKKLLGNRKQITVCEIGCGGGDNLNAIAAYCKKKNIQVSFIGIDIKDSCISYAKENCKGLQVEWICKDYRLAEFNEQPDIIFNALFCHHFRQGAVEEICTWMYKNSKLGFFINDLQRNPIAFYSIKWLTQLFSNSYLVRHDAPLSVARGFKRKEWLQVFAATKIPFTAIRWVWAFRYLIIVDKSHDDS